MPETPTHPTRYSKDGQNKAMFDKILESLDTPQTSRVPPNNWRQAPDTSNFVLNRKRSAQPQNNSLASMQAQLINNNNHNNFDNYIRHSRPPPENTPQNNQRRAFNSLENLEMINSVMQDPQAKKKFVVESSGKPFSVDISTEKGQMAPQFMGNSSMNKRMAQRPPSFESGPQNRMAGYKVYSPVKCQNQKQNQQQPRTMTMAGSPLKYQNSMKRNGGFSRGPGMNNVQMNMPKNNNNNRPNMQERQHQHQQNQHQHQQNLQMLNQNFLNDPKNGMQKGAKKRGPSRPPIIREGDWLCSKPNCENINWAKRQNCHLCSTRRPHLSAVKKRPYMLTKLYEANTWSCPKCKNIIKTEHSYCCICGECRTQDINDGLRAVQRSIAYDRKDSQAGTRVTVSRADPMGTDDLMEQMCTGGYEYSEMDKNEQSGQPEEPDTEYLLEHNVRQNFGTEEQSSAKWYKYSENSQRPY